MINATGSSQPNTTNPQPVSSPDPAMMQDSVPQQNSFNHPLTDNPSFNQEPSQSFNINSPVQNNPTTFTQSFPEPANNQADLVPPPQEDTQFSNSLPENSDFSAPIVTQITEKKLEDSGSTHSMPSKKNPSLKLMFGGALMLFLFVAIGAGLYLMQMNQDTRNQAWLGEELVEQNAQNIITNSGDFQGFVERKNNLVVGNVSLTVEDLNKRFSIFYPESSEYTNNPSLWREVAEKLVREASLQDYASKEGVLPNQPQKFDPTKVALALEYFETRGTNHISGEVLTLWFYNTTPPEMGLERARSLQEQRINDIRTKIESGQLTMEQAGEEIKNMTEIGEIDPVWVGNTYSKFEYVSPDQKVFIDPKMNDFIWGLESGQLSEVVVGQDFHNSEPYDAYFSIVKINAKETQKQANNVLELKEAVQVK